MTSPPTLVFDLDGTLAETAPDIMGTLNHLLAREGLKPLPLASAGTLVGAGARALLERGFQAAGHPLSAPKLDALFADFLMHYLDHVADHSFLFDGVVPALETLAAKGHRLAVCPNGMRWLCCKRSRFSRFSLQSRGEIPLPSASPIRAT
jgi:phosphoglycolate phosphatase